MKNIKVAMCDDAEYLCNNIKNYFNYAEGLEFVGYTTEAASCGEMIAKTQPDVLLLDVRMESDAAGIDILPELFDIKNDLKVIMLTSYMDNQYIFDSLANGASDYIIKSCSNDELIKKIKSVYNDCNTLEPEIFNIFKKKSHDLATAHKSIIFMLGKLISLSPNEFQVLKALYNGDSYSKIAKERVVEDTTVRSMGSRILKKFGESNMRELINNLKELQIFELFHDL